MIKVNGEEIRIEHFPDGTQRLNVTKINPNYNEIIWNYEKEEELSALIYVTKHIRDQYGLREIHLKMFYCPNARMDRTQNCREVFTLKYFADVINWLGFDSVEILDVHSNVGAALLNKVWNKSPQKYVEKAIDQIASDNLVLYFPDAGAAKRYGSMFSDMRYCYGEKVRDWESGKILGLDVKTNGIDLNSKTVLMVDDIIAYGGSLHFSAKALKETGVDKIYAYATHTENSVLDREKGTLIKSLEDGTVERLFTTDSLFTGKHNKITVMEV